jgi:hypothetical protein
MTATALLLIILGVITMETMGTNNPYRHNTADKVGATMLLIGFVILVIVIFQAIWKYLP